MRLPVLALTLCTLAGCSITTATVQGEATVQSEPDRFLGDWDFVASRGLHVLNGTLDVDADGSQMTIPGFSTDSRIQNERLSTSGDTLRLQGTLQTMSGPGHFVLTGVVRADTLHGEVDIRPAGLYTITAVRPR